MPTDYSKLTDAQIDERLAVAALVTETQGTHYNPSQNRNQAAALGPVIEERGLEGRFAKILAHNLRLAHGCCPHCHKDSEGLVFVGDLAVAASVKPRQIAEAALEVLEADNG